MKIKSSLHNMPEAEQPRERLMSYGVKNISTAELIAIILKTGTTDKNVIMLSNEVLSTIRSISDLQNITVNKLMNIKGIGRVKALELVAALELGRRVNQNDVYVNDKLSTPCDIYDHFKNLFDNLKQEQFYCFYLDSP